MNVKVSQVMIGCIKSEIDTSLRSTMMTLSHCGLLGILTKEVSK